MIEAFTKFSAIVHYKQFGGTVRHVARKYGVSKSSVSRWVNDDPGCVKIKRLRRKRKSAVKTLSKFIVQSMDFTNRDYQDALNIMACGIGPRPEQLARTPVVGVRRTDVRLTNTPRRECVPWRPPRATPYGASQFGLSQN